MLQANSKFRSFLSTSIGRAIGRSHLRATGLLATGLAGWAGLLKLIVILFLVEETVASASFRALAAALPGPDGHAGRGRRGSGEAGGREEPDCVRPGSPTRLLYLIISTSKAGLPHSLQLSAE